MEEKENQQDNKITKLETCFEFMNEKLTNIEKMVYAFDAKLDQALSKKADKWVERVMIWAGITVGTVIVGILVRTVIFLEIK